MHSLKNTFMAVLLLGASYGVYQVITTPSPSMEAEQGLIGPITHSDQRDSPALADLNPQAKPGGPATFEPTGPQKTDPNVTPSQPRVQLPDFDPKARPGGSRSIAAELPPAKTNPDSELPSFAESEPFSATAPDLNSNQNQFSPSSPPPANLKRSNRSSDGLKRATTRSCFVRRIEKGTGYACHQRN